MNEIVKTEIETTPSALLQLAVQNNLDIDKLERLMQLQERWQADQSRKEFLTAISKFQAQCPPLEKTKKVAFGNTKYSYAPLGEIAATIKAAMSENGLSHRWEISDETDKIICTCIISHLTGHSEKTTMSAAKDNSGSKNEIQQRGSSITYLQRYTLIAALGISTADEDNDGRKEEKEQPFVVPDPWKRIAVNCKTPEDVDRAILKNSETVNAHPELKKFLQDRRDELSQSIITGAPHELGEKPVTLHNHKEIAKNGLPIITNGQFKAAMQRIAKGEIDIYYKVKAEFSLEEKQEQLLKETYNEAKKIKENV